MTWQFLLFLQQLVKIENFYPGIALPPRGDSSHTPRGVWRPYPPGGVAAYPPGGMAVYPPGGIAA